MSAQNKQLKWVDIVDFSPGLTTIAGELLEPPTGASQMDDCLVSPYGGLKAAMRAVAFPTTGIANLTTVVLHGLFIRGGVGPTAADTDHYIWLRDGTNLKVYRWDESLPATSWALLATIALGGTTLNGIVADTFIDSVADEYVVFNVFQSVANDGVWSIKRSDGSVVKRLAIPINCVVVQDNIIIAANGATLRWTAAQSVSSWPAENNHPVQPSRQGSIIVTMNAFAPSDLLLGQGFAPWMVVQGDITQPLTRSMSNARIPIQIQRTPQTTGGVAFIAPDQGVFLTTDGNQFTDISQPIAEGVWRANAAPIGYSNHMMLCASGGGYIYDERTSAWHKTSAITTVASMAAGDVKVSEIFAATETGSTLELYAYDAALSTLAGTFTWKGVPLRSEVGREIVIREVQVYAHSFDSNATVAVTVDGVTHTITIASASKQQLSYRFLARGETLDVKVVSSAGVVASAEAPAIEVVRIGYTPGHLLTP